MARADITRERKNPEGNLRREVPYGARSDFPCPGYSLTVSRGGGRNESWEFFSYEAKSPSSALMVKVRRKFSTVAVVVCR